MNILPRLRTFTWAALLLLPCARVDANSCAINLPDQPTPGRLVRSIGGTLVGKSNGPGDVIILAAKKTVFETGHRYRVSFDYEVLEAPAPDGTACLFLREKHAATPTLLRRAPGAVYHAAYEFVAEAGDDFKAGVRGPGGIAITHVRIEEL